MGKSTLSPLLLAAIASFPSAVLAASEVHINGIGTLPIWLVVIIIIIIVALFSGFIYLVWRQRRGDRDPEEAAAARRRFRESGNWKNRWSRVVKESDGPFRAGTMLGGPAKGSPKRTPSTRETTAHEHTIDMPRTPAPLLAINSEGRSSPRRAKSTAERKGTVRSVRHHRQDSAETLDYDPHKQVLDAAKDKGELGLGAGLFEMPMSSVIKIEEESHELPQISTDESGLLFPTLKSIRSAHSANDDKTGLHRSNTVKSGLTREHSRRSTKKPTEKGLSTSPRANGPLLSFDSDDDVAPSDAVSPARTRSISRRDDDRVTRSASHRDRPKSGRSPSRGATQKSSRSKTGKSSTREHSERRNQILSDDDSEPIGRALTRHRSRREEAVRAAGADTTRSRSSRRSRSTRQQESSRRSSSVAPLASRRADSPKVNIEDDEDSTPLAAVALQALQQNLTGLTRPSSGGQRLSMEDDRPLGTLGTDNRGY
ncbi:hypothetical protein HDU85_002668 [Gaertneriomyces sp. JEL0708]|nr:hypothetical protein HDU85_002668 [Gaertneriomyces sp. JEL0708]